MYVGCRMHRGRVLTSRQSVASDPADCRRAREDCSKSLVEPPRSLLRNTIHIHFLTSHTIGSHLIHTIPNFQLFGTKGKLKPLHTYVCMYVLHRCICKLLLYMYVMYICAKQTIPTLLLGTGFAIDARRTWRHKVRGRASRHLTLRVRHRRL